MLQGPVPNFLHDRQAVPLPLTPNDELIDDVTIVTAYINLGEFQKGDTQKFGPGLYNKWMASFSNLSNPVVAFMEEEHVELFRNVRRKQVNNTIVKAITTQELWAFSLKHRVQDVFKAQHINSKQYPNNQIPTYSCSQHAKYELVLWVTNWNPFGTKYIAWLDIGYFRDVVDKQLLPNIHLYKPKNFPMDKVAYGQINPFNYKYSVEEIFASDYIWIGGGMFFATMDVMHDWTLTYMAAVEKFLDYGMMSTDQQVLYAMGAQDPTLRQSIKTYQRPMRYPGWFHLGYMCMDEGAQKFHTSYWYKKPKWTK